MKKRLPYPQSALLPRVSYPDSEDAPFGDPVLDLEYTTLRNLEKLADEIRTALIEEDMIQMPETLVAHFCAYLGYLSVSALGLERATALEKPLTTLVQSQAQGALELFGKYPINSNEAHLSRDNVEQCKNHAPGSIIVQTIRFGRHVFDIMGELETAHSVQSGNQSKQTEMFCSIDRLMIIFKQQADDLKKQSAQAGEDLMLDINQTAIQIGYLMGYYGHFDGTSQRYYEYGLPCIPLFIEYGHKFIRLGVL